MAHRTRHPLNWRPADDEGPGAQNGRVGRLYSDLAALRATAYMTGEGCSGGGWGKRRQQLLDAELVDELRVDIMPVFLGTGRRFLDNASLERVRLEKIDAQEIGARTCLRFRVNQ